MDGCGQFLCYFTINLTGKMSGALGVSKSTIWYILRKINVLVNLVTQKGLDVHGRQQITGSFPWLRNTPSQHPAKTRTVSRRQPSHYPSLPYIQRVHLKVQTIHKPQEQKGQIRPAQFRNSILWTVWRNILICCINKIT